MTNTWNYFTPIWKKKGSVRITKNLAFVADLPRPGTDRTLIKLLTVLALLVIAAMVFRDCH